MTKLSKELKELVEGVISAKSDKKVIDAFLDGGAMIGEKLETDGEILNGKWSVGNGIAKWEGKKIVFADLGSKASSDVEKAVRKAAPKDLIEEVIDDEQEDVVEAYASSRADSDAERSELEGKKRRDKLKGDEKYIEKEVSRVKKGIIQLSKEIGQLSTIIEKKSAEDLEYKDVIYLTTMTDQLSNSFLRVHHYANFLKGLVSR